MTMCHYPMYSWYRKPEGAVLLHGHSHGNLDEFNRNSLELKADIGVEGELFQSIKRIPTLQEVYEFSWPRQKHLVCRHWLFMPDTATGSRKPGVIWNIVQKLIRCNRKAVNNGCEEGSCEDFGRW